jgi:FkbM family methyltransferase
VDSNLHKVWALLTIVLTCSTVYLAVMRAFDQVELYEAKVALSDAQRSAAANPPSANVTATRSTGSTTVVQRRTPPSIVAPFRPVDFTADVEGIRYMGNSSNFIDLRIMMYGAFEKPILNLLRDTMHSLRPSGDGVFADVGANTGQHSLFMSQHAKAVHAFDPYLPVVERFEEMIEANEITNITVHRVGLGSEPARIPFFEPPESNLGTGSFVEGFKRSNKPFRELEIVVGDSILAAPEVGPVDLMKIDIEGYEKHALEGLDETLRTSRPIVLMEVTIDPGLDNLFTSMQELLAAFPPDYGCFEFEDVTGDYWTGDYSLRPCRLNFASKQQHDVVMYPVERRQHIPLRSGGTSQARAGGPAPQAAPGGSSGPS